MGDSTYQRTTLLHGVGFSRRTARNSLKPTPGLN
jgi:hypothetical protein